MQTKETINLIRNLHFPKNFREPSHKDLFCLMTIGQFYQFILLHIPVDRYLVTKIFIWDFISFFLYLNFYTFKMIGYI